MHNWVQNFVDNIVDKFRLPGAGLAMLLGLIIGIAICLWIRYTVNKDWEKMNQD